MSSGNVELLLSHAVDAYPTPSISQGGSVSPRQVVAEEALQLSPGGSEFAPGQGSGLPCCGPDGHLG